MPVKRHEYLRCIHFDELVLLSPRGNNKGEIMETGQILATKLKAIATAASTTDSEIDKAALFAASQAILKYFESDEDKWDRYTHQKVSGAAWHIAAALGYGPDNGHNRSQHVSWAYGEIDTLLHVISSRLAIFSSMTLVGR